MLYASPHSFSLSLSLTLSFFLPSVALTLYFFLFPSRCVCSFFLVALAILCYAVLYVLSLQQLPLLLLLLLSSGTVCTFFFICFSLSLSRSLCIPLAFCVLFGLKWNDLRRHNSVLLQSSSYMVNFYVFGGKIVSNPASEIEHLPSRCV